MIIVAGFATKRHTIYLWCTLHSMDISAHAQVLSTSLHPKKSSFQQFTRSLKLWLHTHHSKQSDQSQVPCYCQCLAFSVLICLKLSVSQVVFDLNLAQGVCHKNNWKETTLFIPLLPSLVDMYLPHCFPPPQVS